MKLMTMVLHIVARALFIGALAFAASQASAQNYPSRSITVVVPFPAGGSADTLARLIGAKLSESLGQAVVVENKPGAGGNLGTDAVAKAAPDGYTLLLTPSSIAIAPALYAKLPFDPIKDFAPVTLVGSIPMVVVVYPEFPPKTLLELIALAKAKPGEISYASAGNGSTNHLAVELFKIKTGIDMLHVPYRGNPLAIVDVIAGRVPVFFDFVLTGLPHVREGKVRALAVTGAHRSPVLPDVPTVAEAGVPGFEASTWFGVYAPAGTKPAIVEKLNAEILAVLAMPAIRERLTGLGVDILAEGPQGLAALTKSDLEKWGPIVQKAGVKLD
ncbi:MAG TPA: tripartite tricarboxylate transporter substrate binding protein [Xanthobacteraceae bacterium]|nr:tripartite tricarboxylate transporter substrate binding protein [Xanthobacteraceae bacterium]